MNKMLFVLALVGLFAGVGLSGFPHQIQAEKGSSGSPSVTISNASLQFISIYSCYHGQSQLLTLEPNSTGYLMYPEWHITFISTSPLNYSVYVGDKSMATGRSNGISNVSFNVTGSGQTITVIFGAKTYTYRDVLISTIPISKYYGPKPPPLAYTYTDVEYALAKGFMAALFAVLIALIVGKKVVLEKEKRSVIFI